MTESILPQQFLLKSLKNGASKEMAVDGSVTPVNFDWECPAGETFYLARANIFILDAGPSPNEFGGLSELTNGVLIEILDEQDNVIKVFNDGDPLKKNSDFGHLAGIDVKYELGAGLDSVNIRWTFSKHSGGPLMKMPEGYTFRAIVQDDLTGLEQFNIYIQGHKPNTGIR